MIHGMMLVRNEASRKLGIFNRVLRRMNSLCDRLVICDDNSDDNTFDVCSNFTYNTFKMSERIWDKNEVEARKKLWDKTIVECKHGDWIVCFDADELLDDVQGLRYMLNNLTDNIDGLGFRLFDMWNMTHYREDHLWNAHGRPWCFAVRYDKNKKYVWHDKTLHCGRFPANGSDRMLPTMIPVRHYGWALEEDRIKKYERYMRIDGKGENGILAQYESILDKNPRLIEFVGGSL